MQKRRGADKYRVIPFSRNHTKLGVLEEFFGEEPAYIPVSSGAGGIEVAVNEILVAMGKRLRTDVAPTPQPEAEPLVQVSLSFRPFKP